VKWSAQQESIFRWFAGSPGNLIVRARAGTGKTTTIIEAVERAPERDILLCAFNKRIADELRGKLRSPRATAKTLHAVGFGAIARQWAGVQVDPDRGARLALEACGAQAPDEMIALVKKLAALGKNMAPFGDVDVLSEIAAEFDCDPDEDWEEDGWTIETVAEAARRAMDAALVRDGTIDFDDMLFVAVANRFARPAHGLVVVDEAQDMCATQLLLAQRVCRKDGRIVVVGDDRQAIYGFRGADAGGMDRLKKDLAADELGLTITYRCPRAVVDIAARLVPDYQAAPEAPVGIVLTVAKGKMFSEAQPGDAILSRLNAPLVSTCLRLLAVEHKRARVEGRDIGKGLVARAKKIAGKRTADIADFVEKVVAWRERELRKAKGLSAAARAARRERVTDDADMLIMLSEGCSGMAEMQGRIADLFDDSRAGDLPTIVCSSVHRAKGLEWDRVFILRDTLYPGNRRSTEEENIEYVAVTRAKSTLCWVTK